MGTASLADFRTRVRERADMEESQFIDDTELTRYILASLGRLYDKLVVQYEDYYTNEIDTQFPPGARFGFEDDLPNFYKLLDVLIRYQGQWFRMGKYTRADRVALLNMQGAQPIDVKYDLRGDGDGLSYLAFAPAMPAQVEAKILYIPQRPQWGENDLITFPGDWEEFAVVDAAIKCLAKEESDTTSLREELAQLSASIDDVSANRDPGEVQRVGDVTGYDTYSNYPFPRTTAV